MIDKEIVGCNWIEIPAGSYLLSLNRTSNTQIEIDVSYPTSSSFTSYKPNSFLFLLFFIEKHITSFDVFVFFSELTTLNRHEHIISHKPDGEWLKLAPLRILSFGLNPNQFHSI
jgi:hypothetical protein